MATIGPIEFQLFAGLNKDPRLYLKFKDSKAGVELHLDRKEIQDIKAWCDRVLD